MKIGMFQIGVVALAGGVLAVAGAGWSAVASDAPQPVGTVALEVERLEAPTAAPAEGGRDLLSGRPAGEEGGPTDPSLTPDGPVEIWMNRAVAADPFRPDRLPGPGYQLPWERRSWDPPEVEEEDPPELPEFRVVGIVVPGGNRGGAALIQQEGGEPRLYRVGERVGGYELTALAAEAAVLEGPAGALNFMVDQPWIDDRGDDDRRRGRRDDDERQRRREEAMRERDLQRARARVIEAIRRRTGGNDVPAPSLPR